MLEEGSNNVITLLIWVTAEYSNQFLDILEIYCICLFIIPLIYFFVHSDKHSRHFHSSPPFDTLAMKEKRVEQNSTSTSRSAGTPLKLRKLLRISSKAFMPSHLQNFSYLFDTFETCSFKQMTPRPWCFQFSSVFISCIFCPLLKVF